MKNLRILSMLLIATIAGLAAMLFASRWLIQQGNSGTTKVAVAAVDVNLGQRLSPEFIRLVDWPAASLPPGAISTSTRSTAGSPGPACRPANRCWNPSSRRSAPRAGCRR